MSDFDNENSSSLGRGRGRSNRVDPELRATSSSASEKRSATDATGNGNGNNNNNGHKRGTVREQRNLGPNFHRTTPLAQGNSKEGTSGRILTLSANYFKMIRKPNFEFTLYRVDFEPDIELAGLRKAFVGKLSEQLGGYLFDGANMIYLTHRLEQERIEINVTSRELQEYRMTIKNTGKTIEMDDSMANQILNLILRRTMDGLKMELVGRNLYDPIKKVVFNEFKIELWPGYVTSIRQHERDVLVCTEVSHKVMRNDTIYEMIRDHRHNDASNWKENFKKEILGSIVLTDYNNKTYRVDDVDFNSSSRDTFDQKGTQISYVDYYKQKYNKTIRDHGQPMLVSNPKARDVRAGRTQVLFLVPELCRATGLTDRMRTNFQMMKAMATHTQMDPEHRVKRLIDFTDRIHSTPESMRILGEFNTDIDRRLIEFKGRALKQETILFGNDKSTDNDEKVDWTNPMKMNQMYQTISLKRWALVYPIRCERESRDFLGLLREVANGMRYEMGDPKIFVLPDDRTPTYTAKIQEILSQDPKMIMVVVPNNGADRYAAIKRLTCVNKAVPTQVIVHKTMMPKKGGMGGVMSIATKVMIQLNCKLGGAPWMIKYPIKGVMTIGFDVTHDTRDRSKSYGAFVASMDLKQVVEYFSAVSAHKDGQEMSTNITTHMAQALKSYFRRHNGLPERIFFYRDGVGDGQIEYIHTQEVIQLRDKINELYAKGGGGKTPKFTFIIVNKRLNTRIFNKQGPNRFSNPISGTIVDNTITLPERYDFFLVSQSVRQGTVAPTSYNIIHDTNGLTPDQMQILTYKQTHLYYNWSGTTRVPAPVQYAHKLAFLVGQHLHQPPNPDFERNLHFL